MEEGPPPQADEAAIIAAENNNAQEVDDETDPRWIAEMDLLVWQAIFEYTDGSNDLSSIQRLVDASDVNRANDDGFTALHYACCEGKLDIVRYLVNDCQADTSCEIPHVEETPFFLAVKHGHLAVAKFLLAHDGPSLSHQSFYHCNYKGKSPLHCACQCSGPSALSLVQWLIQESKACQFGAISLQCVDEMHRTPLHYACGDPCFDEDDGTHNPDFGPSHMHRRRGSLEVVKWIIQEIHKHNDLGSDKKSAFDISSDNTDTNGATPLAVACANGNLSIARYSIEEEGASITVTDTLKSWTALHYVCIGVSGSFERSKAVLNYLLDQHCQNKNGDDNDDDDDDDSLQNITDDASLFHRRRVLLEEPDCDGNTPLMLTLRHENWDLAEYLLNHYSVCTATRNRQGQTAWDIAQRQQQRRVTDFMKVPPARHRPVTVMFRRRQAFLEQRWNLVQYLVAQELLRM